MKKVQDLYPVGFKSRPVHSNLHLGPFSTGSSTAPRGLPTRNLDGPNVELPVGLPAMTDDFCCDEI